MVKYLSKVVPIETFRRNLRAFHFLKIFWGQETFKLSFIFTWRFEAFSTSIVDRSNKFWILNRTYTCPVKVPRRKERRVSIDFFPMDRALQRFHGLVQIWSVECLQAFEEMSRRGSSSDIEENESKFCESAWTIWVNSFVIFFLSAIIRYLGSRFQETLLATDEDNRTALHYAATIKDNGHFYNLLVHLGANPKLEDNVSDIFIDESLFEVMFGDYNFLTNNLCVIVRKKMFVHLNIEGWQGL